MECLRKVGFYSPTIDRLSTDMSTECRPTCRSPLDCGCLWYTWSEQSTLCINKTRYVLMMLKRTICGKRAGFPFLIKKNTEVIIFPQAQWNVRVRKTQCDYVIWVNIQRRIKGNLWHNFLILMLWPIKLRHLYSCFVHHVNANQFNFIHAGQSKSMD